jgi:flagellar protein FlbT
MHISLRAGERFYINGAVLRVDRKVSLELLNDATFLLEAHVMHVGDVTTPLRQLYFIVQIMLMNPADTPAAREMFAQALRLNGENFDDPEILAGLANAEQLVAENRKFDALKAIRALLPIEAEVLCGSKSAAPTQAA